MSFQTSMRLFRMLNINKDILMVPIDFHIIYFTAMEVNENQKLFGSSEFFKISFFRVLHKKGTLEWHARVNYDKILNSLLAILK